MVKEHHPLTSKFLLEADQHETKALASFWDPMGSSWEAAAVLTLDTLVSPPGLCMMQGAWPAPYQTCQSWTPGNDTLDLQTIHYTGMTLWTRWNWQASLLCSTPFSFLLKLQIYMIINCCGFFFPRIYWLDKKNETDSDWYTIDRLQSCMHVAKRIIWYNNS